MTHPRRLVRWVVAMLLATLASQVATAGVYAECTRTDRWPAFTRLAPAAGTILLGRVAESLVMPINGQTTTFRVDVIDVLRGDAPASFRVETGTRFADVMKVCDESELYAQVGDVLAFAFSGQPGASIDRVVAVAWVEGRPDRFFMPGVQKLSENRVRALAELPATDAFPARAQRVSREGPWPGFLFLITGALGAMALVLRRSGRSTARPPTPRLPNTGQ